MSTTVTVSCPTCGKSYNAPRERAGARFKCKQCGETLTVPASPEPPAAAERPVVMPAPPAAVRRAENPPVVVPKSPPVVAPKTPPVAQPARPVVAPSPAPAPARGPVVAPSAPAAAERSRAPVVEPAAAPAPEPARAPVRQPAAARAPRPERPSREPRPATEPAPKGRSKVILIAAGAALVLGAGGWFAFSGGEPDTAPKPPPSPVTPSDSDASRKPAYDAAKRAAEIKAEAGGGSAAQTWAFVQKLVAEAEAWRKAGAPEGAVQGLVHERDVALDDLVKLEPDHAGARALRDEVRYGGELDGFGDGSYLSDADRDLVRRARQSVSALAGGNGGWISKKTFETQVQPLVERFGAERAAAESQAMSPFGRAAKALEQDTLAYLNTTMGGTSSFRAFVHAPYVIFVEENPGWSPQGEARSLFSPLKAILDAFLTDFKSLGLSPLDVPVPVIYFMSEKQYEEYNKKIGNTGMRALAHYEPPTGRLVLNRGVSHEVIIHEGTHQVFDKYTKNMLKHEKQSFWFQEGIAEWFGGSNRLQGADGAWRYETGMLLDGRLDSWRALESGAFSLDELVQQTYAKRNDYIASPGGQSKIGLVYAQGWFLIYFLNHFDVGPDGLVRIGKRGKYADGWDEYLKAELNGRTGKKVFMECLKLDDAGLAKMDGEFKNYFEFVMRKRNLGQVKEKKLIPWNEYVNKKGVKTGEREDDLLVAPARGADK